MKNDIFNGILIVLLFLLMAVTSGCVATAPVSVAWRSNAHQQYATTEGKNDTKAGGDRVNADKTTETQAAVTTSSGNAQTSGATQNANDGGKNDGADLKDGD